MTLEQLDAGAGHAACSKLGAGWDAASHCGSLLLAFWLCGVEVGPSFASKHLGGTHVVCSSKISFCADVYSYGITLWELLTWQLPWAAANPWNLASHVLAGGRPEVPPREALPGPDTAAFAGLEDYVELMQRCWSQAPQDRPTFQHIVPALRWARAAEAHCSCGSAAHCSCGGAWLLRVPTGWVLHD